MSSESLLNALTMILRISLIIAVGSHLCLARARPDKMEQRENSPETTEKKNGSQVSASKHMQGPLPQYRVEGSGPLLVYISGLDGTGELFFKQAPALTRSYRVVTFRSRDSGRFSYDDLAGDVSAIIRDVGEERATIVAESFGGGVALTFALRYPAMVERLVIVNSFARFRSRVKIKLGILFASAFPFWLTSVARKTANEMALRADGVQSGDRRLFFKAIHTVKREGYTQRLKLIPQLNLENRLVEIKTPTLFIAGEKDMLVPSAREARSMAALMPNAQVRLIARAGHACLLGDRVRLAEILAEWTGR
jgi:pimeloyl-ACP methyl ester carboxylesterase